METPMLVISEPGVPLRNEVNAVPFQFVNENVVVLQQTNFPSPSVVEVSSTTPSTASSSELITISTPFSLGNDASFQLITVPPSQSALTTQSVNFPASSTRLPHSATRPSTPAVDLASLPPSSVEAGKNLIAAAERGDAEMIRKLLIEGAPVATDWLGISALHLACQHGHVASAEVLLRAGVSCDLKSKVNRTPLHLAAQAGMLASVQLLLRCGADVDSTDMLRMTPLHWAAEKGHTLVCQALLRKGADMEAENKFGRTPLDHAVAHDFRPVISVLKNAQNILDKKSVGRKNRRRPSEYHDILRDSKRSYQRSSKPARICIPVPRGIGVDKIKSIKTPIIISGVDRSTAKLTPGTILRIPGQKGPMLVCATESPALRQPSEPSGNTGNETVQNKRAGPDEPSTEPDGEIQGQQVEMWEVKEKRKSPPPEESSKKSEVGERAAQEAKEGQASPLPRSTLLNLLRPPRLSALPLDPLEEFQSQGPILTLLEDELPKDFLQGQTLALTAAGRLALRDAGKSKDEEKKGNDDDDDDWPSTSDSISTPNSSSLPTTSSSSSSSSSSSVPTFVSLPLPSSTAPSIPATFPIFDPASLDFHLSSASPPTEASALPVNLISAPAISSIAPAPAIDFVAPAASIESVPPTIALFDSGAATPLTLGSEIFYLDSLPIQDPIEIPLSSPAPPPPPLPLFAPSNCPIVTTSNSATVPCNAALPSDQDPTSTTTHFIDESIDALIRSVAPSIHPSATAGTSSVSAPIATPPFSLFDLGLSTSMSPTATTSNEGDPGLPILAPSLANDLLWTESSMTTTTTTTRQTNEDDGRKMISFCEEDFERLRREMDLDEGAPVTITFQ